MELTLVGTGHVFQIGALVQRIIDERAPDVVCVELDTLRLQGLVQRRQVAAWEEAGDPRADEAKAAEAAALKRQPLLYRMLAKTQQKIAAGQGVEAGNEMLAAVDAGKRRGVAVACIDVDAQALVRGAWKQMGFRERVRFAWTLMRGEKADVESEMADYQDDPVAYLAKVGDAFPTLKRVLIDERDAHMARALLSLPQHRDRFPNAPDPLRVVAVVGDGHVEGMLGYLRDGVPEARLETIRVQALRAGDVPGCPFPAREGEAVSDDEGASARVSFTVAAGEETEPDSL